MIKPVDRIPGFRPERSHIRNSDGTYTVTVKPPILVGLPASSVILTEDQFLRYTQWRDGHGLIQDVLPDLNPADREILMTGIGDDDFHRLSAEDDND